ncbi:hypothetical protein CR513_12245, partial [Mucuna pruriens]
MSPLYELYGHSPSYSNLCTFGCVCFVHLHGHEHHKLGAQSVKCAFMGYFNSQKGYVCYKCASLWNECWRKAIQAELEALEENHTRDIVSCPTNVTPLGSKWVFSVKLHSDALGNKQEHGINFEEAFALVAKMTIVQTISTIAASQSWTLHQMDVKNAFLQGYLKEEIYMKLPSGMSSSSPHNYDYSLFFHKSSNGIVLILVYVDHWIINALDQFINKNNRFQNIGVPN